MTFTADHPVIRTRTWRARVRHHLTPMRALVAAVLLGVLVYFVGGALSLTLAVDHRNDVREALKRQAVQALPLGARLIASGTTGGANGEAGLRAYAQGGLTASPAAVFASTEVPAGESGWTEVYREAPGSKGYLDRDKRFILTLTIRACEARPGCPVGGAFVTAEIASGGPNS